MLVLTFGAGGAKKVAVTAAKAGETTITVAESASAANKAARVVLFEKEAAGAVGKSPKAAALLPAPKMHKHHIFPREFKPFFEKAGIKIDEHCLLIPSTSHLTGVHGQGLPAFMPGKYNQRWKTFFKENSMPTQKEIYQFGGRLMNEFKLNNYTMTWYK